MNVLNKAWILDADCDYNALVYAPTRNAARLINADGFEDFEYIEIRARRVPAADEWANEGNTIEYDERRLYELGWHEENPESCEVCDRYCFDVIPESEVCDICYSCAACGCDMGAHVRNVVEDAIEKHARLWHRWLNENYPVRSLA